MVPPDSDRISPVPPYSGSHQLQSTSTTGLSPSSVGFPTPFDSPLSCLMWSYNPAVSHGLGSAPFARHYSEHNACSLFLLLLRCFSSEGSLPALKQDDQDFSQPGCPIRISADRRLLAAPHGFSQPLTSFFATGYLGIPRVLFITCFFQKFLKISSRYIHLLSLLPFQKSLYS
jgi:hypothetical protein